MVEGEIGTSPPNALGILEITMVVKTGESFIPFQVDVIEMGIMIGSETNTEKMHV